MFLLTPPTGRRGGLKLVFVSSLSHDSVVHLVALQDTEL